MEKWEQKLKKTICHASEEIMVLSKENTDLLKQLNIYEKMSSLALKHNTDITPPIISRYDYIRKELAARVYEIENPEYRKDNHHGISQSLQTIE